MGALIDLNYNSFGINTTTLQSVGVPGGGLHVFAATLDPIVHLTPKSHFDLYVTGGGGLYRRMQDFTVPTGRLRRGSFRFSDFIRWEPRSWLLTDYVSVTFGFRW
ncbi:MAG TPA: hypothetical protein VMQ86_03685 [Bryobacteraceae bacterium]|nr:hypothetical protein [Bryobacteraceae bacterium]